MKRITMGLAMGCMMLGVLLTGCGKNYDDPQVFAEWFIPQLAKQKKAIWIPEEQIDQMKFTVNLSKNAKWMEGDESYDFTGTAILPSDCYVIMNMNEDTVLMAKEGDDKNLSRQNYILNAVAKADFIPVEKLAAGSSLEFKGQFCRQKNPGKKDIGWDTEGYTEFYPTRSGIVVTVANFARNYSTSKALVKGSAEYEKFFGDTTAAYEALNQAVVAFNAAADKSNNLGTEVKNLSRTYSKLVDQYNSTTKEIDKLNKNIAEKKKATTPVQKRAAARDNSEEKLKEAEAKFDKLNGEAKAAKVELDKKVEEYKAAHAEYEKAKAELKKLDPEIKI